MWLTLADQYLHSISIDWEKTLRFAFNERSNPDDDSLGIQIVKVDPFFNPLVPLAVFSVICDSNVTQVFLLLSRFLTTPYCVGPVNSKILDITNQQFRPYMWFDSNKLLSLKCTTFAVLNSKYCPRSKTRHYVT